ncbi:hypothetical protein [Gaiella sp.]|uniref:hypothetical protein n=1 Tax=Gaiella sp. TaxID=2663207 RepID=UPI003982F0E2
MTAVTGFGVLVAALTPIGGTLAKVLPSFTPDARGPFAGSIEVVAVEPDVTPADLRNRVDQSEVRRWYDELFGTVRPTPQMLATRGAVVYLRMKLKGFEHREPLIRGRLYRTDGTAVRGPDVPRIPETRVDARSGSGAFIEPIFVPAISQPTVARRTFVRFELVEDIGARSIVAVVDTPPLQRGKPRQAATHVDAP